MPESTPPVLPPLPTLRTVDHVLVVVPTCGNPATVVPGLRRLLKHTDGLRVRIVVVANPDDGAKWREAHGMIDAASKGSDASLDCIDLAGPVGFGAAVNAGIAHATRTGGLPEHVVVVNDDAHVSAGWLSGMIEALDPVEGVVLTGEPPNEDGSRTRRDAMLAVGRIGMVGPVSNLVAGVAQVRLPDGLRGAPYDVVAAQVRQQAGGDVEVVDFLSGFCVLYRRDCLLDLMADDGRLFDERFGIGGYEDNDVCVRAEIAGWGRVVARSVYVHHDGHQTLDRIAPGAKRGLRNRSVYLDKWKTSQRVLANKLVAIYRVKLETTQDLAYLRASLAGMGEMVDGVAILLNGNPLEITNSPDFAALIRSLPADDHTLLRDCSGKDQEGVAEAVRQWARAAACGGKNPRGLDLADVAVEVWRGDFNERDERNHLIGMGEALGANWLFSVDHDEVPEGRIDRNVVDRLMRTPDPLVYAWDVAFTTLWDSPRTQRVDRPWGDGGSYQGGMRGFRLFRASASPRRPRRIAAGNEIGLHCGNVPDSDPLAKRVSSIRMLHYGYVRAFDRARKHARYLRLDPNPNAIATGGGYGHLVAEENMALSPVVSNNAIGLAMMLHPGETAHDLARQLDQYHGLVDAIVLIWTGDVSPGAVGGASDEMREVASHYGAAWVYQPLNDDFATARNAGLDYLRAYRSPGTNAPIAWAYMVDPDELLSEPFGDVVALRRMAECSDAYGFLIRFANHRPAATGEQPTLSEAIRFVRLDPAGIVRYSGRVHEGFDASFRQIEAAGTRPRIRYAPFTAHNPGLGTDPDELERKVRFYQRLLVAELRANPRNASAWTSLGMQFTNDGLDAKATECFRRAIASDPSGFLAYRELGLARLREGRSMFEMVARLLPPGHDYHRIAAGGAEWLGRFAPDQPVVGLAAYGPDHVPPEADIELPAFPPIDDPSNPFAGIVGGEAASEAEQADPE